MVEQLTRNEQVAGSTPIFGFKSNIILNEKFRKTSISAKNRGFSFCFLI